jgi:hypothetical protein
MFVYFFGTVYNSCCIFFKKKEHNLLLQNKLEILVFVLFGTIGIPGEPRNLKLFVNVLVDTVPLLSSVS